MGGDGIMNWRAGLLWAISNLQHHSINDETPRELDPLYQAASKLIDLIMDAGQIEAKEYIVNNGDASALPLM